MTSPSASARSPAARRAPGPRGPARARPRRDASPPTGKGPAATDAACGRRSISPRLATARLGLLVRAASLMLAWGGARCCWAAAARAQAHCQREPQKLGATPVRGFQPGGAIDAGALARLVQGHHSPRRRAPDALRGRACAGGAADAGVRLGRGSALNHRVYGPDAFRGRACAGGAADAGVGRRAAAGPLRPGAWRTRRAAHAHARRRPADHRRHR